MLSPDQYSGAVEYRAQSASYISKFSALNDIPSLTDQVLDANGNAIRGKFITGDGLSAQFEREFSDYDELRAAVESVNPEALAQLPVNDPKRSATVVQLARDFVLKAPGKNETASTIEVEGSNPDEIRTILQTALAEINRSTAEATRQNIQNLRETTRISIMNEIETVQSELDSKVRAYQYEVAGQVAYLREQAAIARELGIEKGRLTDPASTGVSVNVESEMPFYARGYRAIEKEIELIENREVASYGFHIDGYLELIERREQLLTDNRVSQIDRALEQLPLGEDFQPVVIDLDLMELESTKKTPLILALSVVLGGMFGVLFVLIRSGYQNYQRRKTTA